MKLTIFAAMLCAVQVMAQSGQYVQVKGVSCQVVVPENVNLGPSRNAMSVQIAEVAKDKFRVELSVYHNFLEIAPARIYFCDESGVKGTEQKVTCPGVAVDVAEGKLSVNLENLGNVMLRHMRGLRADFKLGRCRNGAYVPVELLN